MREIRAKSNARVDRQKGYVLLAVMLLVTLMLVALAAELPRISQQIKREKEEEMIHRGKEYAMAIKRYYHATQVSHNTYPTSLEQLESANNMRFLRKRFKDPMTLDGKWRLVHYGEAQINLTPPGGTPGSTGALGNNQINSQLADQLAANGAPAPGASPSFGPTSPGLSNSPNNQPGPGGQLGALPATTSPVQGGGAIIGVASKSKETSIKEFNGSNHYDQWLFVFDPRLECPPQPPGAVAVACQGNGITIASPISPNASPTPAGGAPSGSPTPFPPGGAAPSSGNPQ